MPDMCIRGTEIIPLPVSGDSVDMSPEKEGYGQKEKDLGVM